MIKIINVHLVLFTWNLLFSNFFIVLGTIYIGTTFNFVLYNFIFVLLWNYTKFVIHNTLDTWKIMSTLYVHIRMFIYIYTHECISFTLQDTWYSNLKFSSRCTKIINSPLFWHRKKRRVVENWIHWNFIM